MRREISTPLCLPSTAYASAGGGGQKSPMSPPCRRTRILYMAKGPTMPSWARGHLGVRRRRVLDPLSPFLTLTCN